MHIRKAILVLTLASIGLQAPPQSSTATSDSHDKILAGIIAAAVERPNHVVRYDPAYVKIPYPGGDVPPEAGVCTDEIVRIYRAVGIDLQKEVHEDILQNRAEYEEQLHKKVFHPDSNIDHRRVPVLMIFFSRNGESLPITNRAADYAPGDLITWDLGGGIPHIGLIVDRRDPQSGRLLIVHNIGRGPKMEDVLFDWKITGHYRYYGAGN
jgi:uncharacterized protein YijF (DUF1287 family)